MTKTDCAYRGTDQDQGRPLNRGMCAETVGHRISNGSFDMTPLDGTEGHDV